MATTRKWIEGIGPHTPVADAARRSLEPRLAAVAHCLPLAAHLAEHDIEHVHRLRVATRRAAAAVKLYRDWLPRGPRRSIKKRLRQIRGAAGDARDLDVLATRLVDDYGSRVAPIVALVVAERAAVQPKIVEIAARCRRKDRFLRKASKLLDGIRRPDSHDLAANESDELRTWAAVQLSKIALPFFDAAPDESSDVAALHQFRIRAKRLRYAIELVAPAFGPELRDQVYPIVEELQERLGSVQDHVTARKRFHAWAADETDDSRRALLHDLSDEEARRLAIDIREFHCWWAADQLDRVRALLPSAASTRPAESSGHSPLVTPHPQADRQT
jgi:CHAD domain-containing protein